MREKLLGKLDLEAEFGALIDMHGHGWERTATCPFHDDKTPSLSINVKKGLFNCFGCNTKGDFFAFYSRFKNIPIDEVVQDFAIKYGFLEPIPDATITANAAKLQADVKALETLKTKKGITAITARAYEIGWDGERYWFPIRNAAGACINVFKYLLTSKRVKNKTMPYSAGRGSSIWPLDSLRNKDIYLFEGLTDTLLALQLGLPAITGTGGCQTWRATWNDFIRDKNVHICYDIDLPGQKGMMRVARAIYGVAASVWLRYLPKDDMPANGDFNDFIVKRGKLLNDFLSISEQEYKGEGTDEIVQEDKDVRIYPVTLAEASDAKYYGKRTRFKAVVAGKLLSPYIIPLEGGIHCRRNFSAEICPDCPVSQKDFKGYRFSLEDHTLLGLINVKTIEQNAAIKRKVGVPYRCNKIKITREKSINLEELTLVPEISHAQQESRHVTRVAYSIGQDIETNKTYEFTSITLADPHTQAATHLIYEAKPSESNIDQFKMTQMLHDQLLAFRPKTWSVEDIDAKLAEIYKDYEVVTRIRQRHNLFLAFDLVWHSIRRFNFHGTTVNKGCLDAMILGETRTGKSDVGDLLIQHMRAGDTSDGSTASLAGLMGGLQQLHNGQWQISWGQFILNDLRAYKVDEAHKITFWEQLTNYRSSAIASLTKIRTERAFGRTRLIWNSNPPGNQDTFVGYTHIVEALQDIIRQPEDIARFDFVMATLKNEVPMEVVNAEADPKEKVKRYVSDLCHDLIMFCWSRDKDHVIYTKEAESETLRLATEEGNKYHSSIPIVVGTVQRIKLARLATALAARLFSTDKTGEKVVVLPEHVQYVHRFLNKIYAWPLEYDLYSAKKKQNDELRNEAWLATVISVDIKEALLSPENDKMSQQDMAYIFCDVRDREQVRAIVGGLIKCRALRRTGTSYYTKTRAFIDYLNKTKFAAKTVQFVKERKY